MQLPSSFIQSLKGIKGFDEVLFQEAHQQSPVTSLRLNPLKISYSGGLAFSETIQHEPVPWCHRGFYLSDRPSFTFDPLFHAGCYYVQEASSMFLEQVISQTVNLSQPLKILDVCAAPGGKTTHLQALISANSLLVSNEVIRSRAQVLKDNIIKWGADNVAVTNNDPKDFSALKGYFDVIVVDAPCSGSGLFRRDEAAVQEWSLNNVALCSQRQQRIIADVLPALKENGVLVYATCSFSCEENESLANWMVGTFDMQNLRLQLKESWGITETETIDNHFTYRFWPHHAKGEGFFLAAFRKTAAGGNTGKFRRKQKTLAKADAAFVRPWMKADTHELLSFGDNIYAWPKALADDFDFLSQHLKIIYSGVMTGALMRDKFIPAHALALSKLVSETASRQELSGTDAISFLQRKDISVLPSQKGWQLACYRGHPLGWMNVLANRVNNYYPKEFRILKEQDDRVR